MLRRRNLPKICTRVARREDKGVRTIISQTKVKDEEEATPLDRTTKKASRRNGGRTLWVLCESRSGSWLVETIRRINYGWPTNDEIKAT